MTRMAGVDGDDDYDAVKCKHFVSLAAASSQVVELPLPKAIQVPISIATKEDNTPFD